MCAMRVFINDSFPNRFINVPYLAVPNLQSSNQSGSTGATGTNSGIGHTGPQGAGGPTGPQGTGGPTGPQGTGGPTGPQGTGGSPGAAGPTGPTGAQGPAGSGGGITLGITDKSTEPASTYRFYPAENQMFVFNSTSSTNSPIVYLQTYSNQTFSNGMTIIIKDLATTPRQFSLFSSSYKIENDSRVISGPPGNTATSGQFRTYEWVFLNGTFWLRNRF